MVGGPYSFAMPNVTMNFLLSVRLKRSSFLAFWIWMFIRADWDILDLRSQIGCIHSTDIIIHLVNKMLRRTVYSSWPRTGQHQTYLDNWYNLIYLHLMTRLLNMRLLLKRCQSLVVVLSCTWNCVMYTFHVVGHLWPEILLDLELQAHNNRKDNLLQ